MLDSINTPAQSFQQPPAEWPNWLQHIAATLSHAVPNDERIAFIVDLIQSAADEARLNSLDSVLAHRRHHMECCTDEPAAPIWPIDEADIPW